MGGRKGECSRKTYCEGNCAIAHFTREIEVVLARLLTNVYKLLANWVVQGNQLRSVWEGGFHLDLGNHFRNSRHDIVLG